MFERWQQTNKAAICKLIRRLLEVSLRMITCLRDEMSTASLSLSRCKVSKWNFNLINSSVTAAVLFCQWWWENSSKQSFESGTESEGSTEGSGYSSTPVILTVKWEDWMFALTDGHKRILPADEGDLKKSQGSCRWEMWGCSRWNLAETPTIPNS